MKPTPFKDINKILLLLKNGLISVLGENLVGLYLTGSLTYGVFDRKSSDIDFFVVTNHSLPKKKLLEVIAIHNNIGKLYPEWKKRIDGSYITKKMASSKKPPKGLRPYFNAGRIWHVPFGNEWTIYLYELYKYGISVFGPSPRKNVPKITINDVIEASKKNLLKEWQPKLRQASPFENKDYNRNHLQAYAILTMCRVLYTAKNKNFSTKDVASLWAKKKYGETWGNLINTAQKWKHKDEMNSEKETLNFIKFTIDEVCGK